MLTSIVLTVLKCWVIWNKENTRSMRQWYITNKAYIVLPDFNPSIFFFLCFLRNVILVVFILCYLILLVNEISSPSFVSFLFCLPMQLKKRQSFHLMNNNPCSIFPDSIVCIGSVLVKTGCLSPYDTVYFLEFPSCMFSVIFVLLTIYHTIFFTLCWIQIMITFKWKDSPSNYNKNINV